MLRDICRLAQAAGDRILEVRARTGLAVAMKADSSPVTEADLAANAIIVEGLARLSADPVVSEETSPDLAVTSSRFWLVDPLDGTKDFIAGKDSFVVSIALVEVSGPVLGVIHAPVTGETYWAERGAGAFKAIKGGPAYRIENSKSGDGLRVLASGDQLTPRLEAFLDAVGMTSLQRFGSALKMGRIAEGAADLYPRFGPTSEWDTAAGHAILNEAGCKLVEMFSGRELKYGKPGYLNPGIIACRRDLDFTEIASELRERFRREAAAHDSSKKGAGER